MYGPARVELRKEGFSGGSNNSATLFSQIGSHLSQVQVE
jgi:hypothetical protein